MLKRNSIFTKIFAPIMFIMLLQVVIINIFLFVGGTVSTLDGSVIDILAKNAQNRSMNLEHLMVNYWSNIGHFERSIVAGIDEYLTEHGLALTDVLGDGRREINMLYELSPILLDSLRLTAATGIFIYLLDGDELARAELTEAEHSFNGLYFRNLSPLSPHQHQHADDGRGNLMLVRGHVSVARRHGIPLDSLWDEVFYFDPHFEDSWRSFANPQSSAIQFPNADSVDLSYWNGPHLLNPWSPRDADTQITYTRPLIIDGRLVAIIGTEVQLSHIERHFPARDLDNFRESGFLFLQYEQGGAAADVFSVTGGFMSRLLAASPQVTLTETQTDGLLSLAEHPEVRLVLEPIRIYNPNTPFVHEQWALAAASTEDSLFSMSASVINAVLVSTAAACVIGGALLFIVLRNFSKPIGSVIKQIQNSTGTAVLSHSKTYEIDLLCQTINEMTARREIAEIQIRKERQRYLMALQSSTDTFMEYDMTDDALSIYYFEDKTRQEPSVKVIPGVTELLLTGGFLHGDSMGDTDSFSAFFDKNIRVVKIRAEFFTHITHTEPDDGYFWFSISSVSISDNNGNVMKIISNAREITREKLEENAVIEAKRRDLTTGFYNREYGLETAAAGHKLNLVRIINFDKLEMTYGKIFGGIFIAKFAGEISGILEQPDYAIRFGNSEFLIFCRECGLYNMAVETAFSKLYAGERTDLEIGCVIKTLDSVAEAEKEPVNPVSVFLDLSDKEKINELALELFERTLHISNSVRALIGLIGRLFALDAVIICAYDANFGTNQVAHQWCSPGTAPVSGELRKVPQVDFERYESMLDENGTMVYSAESGALSDTLLCVPGTIVGTYCCSTYDNAAPAGRVLFCSSKPREWPAGERATLHTTAKIIATYISADKSRSASRAKSMFLSRISHEIRTPMNSITGMTNIALASAQQPAVVHDCLKKISTSANYLLSLINDVLEMSRVESGRLLQIDEKPFNLTDFIREIDDLMRFAIEERSIKFDVFTDFTHINVYGDPHRLKQVLINLLGNAFKFTKLGGLITLTITEKTTGRFTFSVKDSGIGIPHDKQATIFDPFEQADPLPNSYAHASGQQGTGLGLAITKNILLAMNSKIELISAPGKGSDFYFTLNMQLYEHMGGETLEDYFDYTGCMSGKRVLLVDDVPINIEVAAFILENAGLIVEAAANGQEALDKFFGAPEGHFDLIMMDIQMPVMNGVEATVKLRRSERAAAIPIVAMTANAFDDELKKYIESGMDGYVTKPLQADEMWKVIKKFI